VKFLRATRHGSLQWRRASEAGLQRQIPNLWILFRFTRQRAKKGTYLSRLLVIGREPTRLNHGEVTPGPYCMRAPDLNTRRYRTLARCCQVSPISAAARRQKLSNPCSSAIATARAQRLAYRGIAAALGANHRSPDALQFGSHQERPALAVIARARSTAAAAEQPG
jgi:hypothetical protein